MYNINIYIHNVCQSIILYDCKTKHSPAGSISLLLNHIIVSAFTMASLPETATRDAESNDTDTNEGTPTEFYGDDCFYIRMSHYRNVLSRPGVPFPYLDYEFEEDSAHESDTEKTITKEMPLHRVHLQQQPPATPSLIVRVLAMMIFIMAIPITLKLPQPMMKSIPVMIMIMTMPTMMGIWHFLTINFHLVSNQQLQEDIATVTKMEMKLVQLQHMKNHQMIFMNLAPNLKQIWFVLWRRDDKTMTRVNITYDQFHPMISRLLMATADFLIAINCAKHKSLKFVVGTLFFMCIQSTFWTSNTYYEYMTIILQTIYIYICWCVP